MTELLNCAISLRLFSAYKHIRDPKQAAEHLESELTTPKQNIGGANRLSQTHGLHISAPEMGTANYGKISCFSDPTFLHEHTVNDTDHGKPNGHLRKWFPISWGWASNVDRQLLALFSK